MSTKQETIADIQYGRAGCGSKTATLEDARAKDKNTTKEDVEEFFKGTLRSKQSREDRTVL